MPKNAKTSTLSVSLALEEEFIKKINIRCFFADFPHFHEKLAVSYKIHAPVREDDKLTERDVKDKFVSFRAKHIRIVQNYYCTRQFPRRGLRLEMEKGCTSSSFFWTCKSCWGVNFSRGIYFLPCFCIL